MEVTHREACPVQARFVGGGGLGQRPHAGQGGRRHHRVQGVGLIDEGVRGRDGMEWGSTGWIDRWNGDGVSERHG